MFKYKLSKNVETLPPSGIRKFFDLVVSAGDDIISLGVGEPDFSTPWHIREATIFALEKGFTSYSENAGFLELREEISAYHHKQTNYKYNPKTEVLVTNGASECIDLALRAICSPGDKVLTPDPGFVCYDNLIRLAGGEPVYYNPLEINQLTNLKDDFCAIILNFPGNPIGNLFSETELKTISEFALQKNCVVISDEIYAELSFDQPHKSFVTLKQTSSQTILINGLSKSHAMTGFRIGWACGNPQIIDAMNRIHQYSAMCASSISQVGAIEALRRGESEMLKMKKEYQDRRDYCLKQFKKLNIPISHPGGAFYLFPDISASGLDDVTFCEKLLAEKQCAIVPGSAFGQNGQGHVRLTYAENLDKIKTFFERFEKFWLQF